MSPIVGLVTFFVPHSQIMFSRPKAAKVGSSAPNPIVFASLNSNNRAQSRTIQRLTISFPDSVSGSSDKMDGPPEKEKSTDMATFGGHDVV